jgi:5-methylcytosine-specific restriction endonuclease McrA
MLDKLRSSFTCEQCGAQFTRPPSYTTRHNPRYCSGTCRQRAADAPPMNLCLTCHRPFRTEPRNRGTRKYCSRACSARSQVKRVERLCQTCGAVFLVRPCMVNSSYGSGHTAEYCSHTCMVRGLHAKRRGQPFSEEHRAAISRARAGRVFPNLWLPPETFTCLQCKQTITLHGTKKASEHRTGRRVHQVCSRRCLYAYRREHPEANPDYWGGPFPTYGPNWQEQRQRALQRDQYTCRRCGGVPAQPNQLQVHHLRPRRDCGDNWELADAIGNLITLCTSCHKLSEWEWRRTRTVDMSVFRPPPGIPTQLPLGL